MRQQRSKQREPVLAVLSDRIVVGFFFFLLQKRGRRGGEGKESLAPKRMGGRAPEGREGLTFTDEEEKEEGEKQHKEGEMQCC